VGVDCWDRDGRDCWEIDAADALCMSGGLGAGEELIMPGFDAGGLGAEIYGLRCRLEEVSGSSCGHVGECCSWSNQCERSCSLVSVRRRNYSPRCHERLLKLENHSQRQRVNYSYIS